MGKKLKNLLVFFIGFSLFQPAFIFAYQMPSVLTLDATDITTSSVTLNGEITNLGDFKTAAVYFQYGKTPSYDQTTLPEIFLTPELFR